MLACSLRAAARAAPLNRAPTLAKRLTVSPRRRTMAAAATAAAPSVKQVGRGSLLLLLLAMALAPAAELAPPSCLAGAAAKGCPSGGSAAKQVCAGRLPVSTSAAGCLLDGLFATNVPLLPAIRNDHLLQDYDVLCKKLKEVSALSGINGLLVRCRGRRGRAVMLYCSKQPSCCTAAAQFSTYRRLHRPSQVPPSSSVLYGTCSLLCRGGTRWCSCRPMQWAPVPHKRRRWQVSCTASHAVCVAEELQRKPLAALQHVPPPGAPANSGSSSNVTSPHNPVNVNVNPQPTTCLTAQSGVLHEKQTEAEIGELLQRLQAANLEAEGLNEYERVRGCGGEGLAQYELVGEG